MKRPGRWITLFAVLIWALFLAFPPGSEAETSERTEQRLPSPGRTVKEGGTGEGFHKNAFQAGFALGAGFGVTAFGGSQKHDLALATAHLGWVVTDVVFQNHWFRGNCEVLAEVIGGAQFDPEDSAVAGLAALLRYNFATGTKWVPFVDGGLGLSYTDIGEPDLSTLFEFIVQGGGGINYFFRKNTALLMQYRWFHLSNAGMEKPNLGTNTQMFMAGVSWFF